ncbi:hypothetical protein E2562_027091 [Oryza meyeriana var. granulata]|uniref:Uncharacterized protein n=1 Tax=Oryza meyeriana var. granulata TaxID=110450 RepID=A0A6G1EZG3_9ORYZ|nr:hypothetical protein E2562_027091 [Oryza meyeriana var. granulata]
MQSAIASRRLATSNLTSSANLGRFSPVVDASDSESVSPCDFSSVFSFSCSFVGEIRRNDTILAFLRLYSVLLIEAPKKQ